MFSFDIDSVVDATVREIARRYALADIPYRNARELLDEIEQYDSHTVDLAWKYFHAMLDVSRLEETLIPNADANQQVHA